LHLDPQEAAETYRRASAECDGSEVSVRTLVQELGMDFDDREGIQDFLKALEEARHDLTAQVETLGGLQQLAETPSEGSELTMFDKLIRILEQEQAPAEEAWEFLRQGKVAMAKAEQKVAATFDGRVDELIERVRRYMVEPPVVNATAGQKVCFDKCKDEVDAIIERCRADGTRFTDLDWNMEATPFRLLLGATTLGIAGNDDANASS
ncbi:unnamed protein product, partial [Polarella glacialis]